ncbi:MAG: enoyl-CoA hydratase [Halobacillus sp.]|uniref:enoyl-CoA hydratase n=1 Tax=Halobacillus sp. TaxID=56800 RepID=UPI003BB0AA9E
MSELVTLKEVNEHVLLLTLNRPEAANALSRELLDQLAARAKEVNQRTDVRAVLITGSGTKVFCAGADLKERADMSEQEVIQTVEKIGATIQLIEQISVPTIAVINGVAFGGGLELALACDLRIMSNSARAGLTETSLGIIPGAGGTQRLSRLIGLGKAKAMIYTARPIEAQRAHAIGLAEYVYEPQLLLEEAKDIAFSIARNAPIALRQAKKAIHDGYDKELSAGLQIEKECYQKTIDTEDRLEGLKAFKEKRKPDYKGK